MAQLPQILQPPALTRWKALLDPVLGAPLTGGSFVQNISVSTGVNVINHKLGQTPVGWFVCDTNAAITLYRSAPFNPLTLTLTSSGAGVVSLYVF